MQKLSGLNEKPQMKKCWSIGLFCGAGPEKFVPFSEAAVLTADMITDVDARYVADPFLLEGLKQWFMFFEILPKDGRKGVIGLATSSDLAVWRYERVVLEADCHLSYPHVFRSDGEVFMIAETLGYDSVSLFRATVFPYKWSFESALLTGQHADPTVFNYNGVWWMFTCPRPYNNDRLHLYFAEELTGEWLPHPVNPIVFNDRTMSRPAGPVVVHENRLLRFAQNCLPVYGTSIRCFEIIELTSFSYVETEVILSPAFQADLGWNTFGMHHLAMYPMKRGGYVACVDGRS